MINAGAGLSSAADTERAAREACAAALRQAGADRADWGLVFATPAHRAGFDDLARVVSEELETSCVVGCSGAGVLTGRGEIERGPGVSVLAVSSDALRASAYLLHAGEDGGVSAAYELASAVAAERPRAGGALADELIVLLPDPYRLQIERLLGALGARLGRLPAVGAAAADDGTLNTTFQFRGPEVASGGIAALNLSGSFQHAIGVTQGCAPIGEPCVVTKARGGEVIELDGRAALVTLAAQLPPSLPAGAAALWRNLFVALPPDRGETELRPGEYLVRNIVRIEPTRGSFTIAANVERGQMLLFVMRERDAAREDLKRMLEEIDPRATGSRYAFGLYFNCAGRGRSLYRLPGVDSAYLAATLGDTPIAGFFGSAELAPLRGVNRLFTYTGVLALFGEPEAEA